MSERVHEDEKRVKIQKRPLFVNIDELYANHKEYASNILRMEPCGRSNFFMFRPEMLSRWGQKGLMSVFATIIRILNSWSMPYAMAK